MKVIVTKGTEEVLNSTIQRIRNELNQGLLITSFFIETEVYIMPFDSSDLFSISYFKDDGTLLQSFKSCRFRMSSLGPVYNNTGIVAEVAFLVESAI